MSYIKYCVCEVDYEFNDAMQRSLCKVSKPLQIFDTDEQAELACDLMSPFYGYNLRVVPSDKLDEEFR